MMEKFKMMTMIQTVKIKA